MQPTLSRREYLVAAGGAVLFTPAAVRSVRAATPCPGGEERSSDLSTRESTREQLDREVATATETVAVLESRLVDLKRVSGPEPAFSAETRQRAVAVGEQLRRSVAYIYLAGGLGDGYATAWFVEESLLLTNSHNVSDARSGHAWTIDEQRFEWEVVDRVEGASPDVALLRTDVSGEPLPVDTTREIEPDTPLVQVGFPGGFGNWVISLGSVLEMSTDSIVSSVPGLTGNSGSPVATLDGTVVAMTYGGQPRNAIPPTGAPEPVSSDVRTLPLAPKEDSLHLPIGLAIEKMEEWT